MSDEEDSYIDRQNEAIFYGTIFPPDRRSASDSILLPINKIKGLKKFNDRGAVISKRFVLSWIIPILLSLLLFALLYLFLPSSIPLISDPFWAFLGFPIIGALILRLLFGQVSGYDEMIQHLASYRYNTRWMVRSTLPARIGRWDTSDLRIQLIKVLSCHPSRTAGRAGSEYEVVPAMVLHGLRPLSNFPVEDDPINNDVIVNPRACRDFEAHPPENVSQITEDKGEPVAAVATSDFEDVRDRQYYRDLAYMKRTGVGDAAIKRVPSPEELLGLDDLSDLADSEPPKKPVGQRRRAGNNRQQEGE